MTTSRPHPTIPVTDDGELTRRWADLLTPGSAGARTLWLAWLRPDGTMVPTVVPIEQLPARGTPAIASGVLDLHDVIAQMERCDPDDLHLTLALERPGPLTSELSDTDEDWGDLVDEYVAERLDQGCSFHVFDGRTVRQLIPRWP
jgi:hypothetical protein